MKNLVEDIELGTVTIEDVCAADEGDGWFIEGRVKCYARGATVEDAKANLEQIVRRAFAADRKEGP